MLLPQEWFFISHYLDRALAAKTAGFDVVIAARDDGRGKEIIARGLKFEPVQFDRRGINPMNEWMTIRAIGKLYKKHRPDVIHHVALKPVLYGTLAAKISGIETIINSPVGMGYVYSSSDMKARLLRPFVNFALKWLLNPPHSKVIAENSEDRITFIETGSARQKDAVLIRGAGVNTAIFHPVERPEGRSTIILVARALKDKGVFEYIEAAKQLRRDGIDANFRLVGAPDPGNPASIDPSVLKEAHSTGDIEWLGQRSDIVELLQKSHIATLPSYREGLPKALLEAMSVGLPIVATDVPGCRELVMHNLNGLLVPAKDSAALASALAELLKNPMRAEQMGRESRVLIEKEFSTEEVCRKTIEVYHAMANKR